MRVEDLRLLVGGGSFAADIELEGQLHARVVRSDVPFGRLNGINAEPALRRPGVVRVITAQDIPEHRIPMRVLPTPDAEAALQTPLATDLVRYVGDPVAVVVAEDPYLAEDAGDAVEFDIEPLEPVLEPVEAVRDGAPLLHPRLGKNVVGEQAARAGEDVAALLDGAAAVVRERFRVQRHGSVPLEPRALIAEYEPDRNRVSLWGAAKVKHFNRRVLAAMLDLDQESVRLVEADVGGGFGARGEFYPEDFLIPWLAIELQRPVKWVEDRRENLMALNHSREQDWTIEAGAAADGTLLGFRARGYLNNGGYVRTHGGVLVPLLTVTHFPGPYRWLGYEVEAVAVVTNKTPAGTYRGPGQFEPTYMRERMVDLLAAQLDVDPVELRRRNLITPEEMPYPTGMIEIDSGDEVFYEGDDYPLVFESLIDHASHAELRTEVDERRGRGERVGLGVSMFVEIDNPGTFEQARLVPEADGTFTAHVGVASVGQGVRTVLAQVAADVLGVTIERVTISHHDTAVIPEGQGAFSSRATVFGGNAVAGAARKLMANSRQVAAERFGVVEGEVEVRGGAVRWSDGGEEHETPFFELGDVEGEFRYEPPPGSVHRSGANLALVEVDPQTGGVSILKFAMCYDVGKAINPLAADGQLVGAIAQGISGTLLEEFTYSEDGQPLATSFVDYAMPTAVEVPWIDGVLLELGESPPDDPLAGAKGLGCGGIIGTAAAVANAVADALGARGNELTVLPITPELVQRLAGDS